MMALVSEAGRHSVRFEPIRPAPIGRIVVGALVGPGVWVVAIAIAAWLLDETAAIEFGLAVAVGSFLVSLVLLGLFRASRRRRERRYVDAG